MRTISEQLVREIAKANPASTRVFETFGIDYCCKGNLSLGAACARANVPVETVAGLLETCEQPSESDAWEHAGLGDLTRHIVERHHGFVRRESPRIQSLLARVSEKHGRQHKELSEVSQLFAALAEELAEHMMKEERILFPYIQALESGTGPSGCFASVHSPIAVMLADHENAGSVLTQIRALTNGYKAPEGACAAFQTLYRSLEEFERDLHWHVHLENNILFPRTIQAESQQRSAPASAN